MIHEGTGIACDCCGDKKMGEVRAQQHIQIRNDGHVVTMTPKEVLQRLSGTSAGSAIMEFVRRVVR